MVSCTKPRIYNYTIINPRNATLGGLYLPRFQKPVIVSVPLFTLVDCVKGGTAPYIPNGLDTSTIVLNPLEEIVTRVKSTNISRTSKMNWPKGMLVPIPRMKQ
ncbi:hypothetical protein AMTR_s00102p00062500 [Amborella trichopoda]|uniref:Uncharacterized protein n=1 Tax=Amborella trichopoda TaxID=13333 RepID=W1NYY7_AMBTC|nr:hypothetical protein AMTR_s00102p00062500 [Amborella trichopoda]